MPPQKDLDINLLSSSNSLSHAGPRDIESLIDEALQGSEGTRMIIDVNGKADYVIWIMPTVDQSPFDSDDAVRQCLAFLSDNKRFMLSIVFQFSGLTPHEDDKDAAKQKGYLLVATRFTGLIAQSIQLPFVEQRNIDERARNRSSSSFFSLIMTYFNRWGYLRMSCSFMGLFFILFLGVYFFNRNHPDHPWIRYDTTGSIGPKYQLQFSHHNVTEWASTQAHGNGEWELRIDDQAMIPASLLDQEEERYQQWFRKHYPEANEIRLKEYYINETFLGDPYAIQVPADKQFHTAHCVLALRRYWKARESGRHVCPRDIDYRHMKHCLDSLDELAFPDAGFSSMHHSHGHSGSGGTDVEEPPIVLLWKTKVCW